LSWEMNSSRRLSSSQTYYVWVLVLERGGISTGVIR
jgi:hypothetical protein